MINNGSQFTPFKRSLIAGFRRFEDSDATAARHPMTKKVHHSSISSAGPNEEICMDGNKKLQEMGIGIYGVIDKFSRYEIALLVVLRCREPKVPLLCFLRYVRNLEGKDHQGHAIISACELSFERIASYSRDRYGH